MFGIQITIRDEKIISIGVSIDGALFFSSSSFGFEFYFVINKREKM